MEKIEKRVEVETESESDESGQHHPYFNKDSWFVYFVVFASIVAIYADKIF